MDIEKFRLAAPGEGIEGHNIKKMHFLMIGSSYLASARTIICLGVPWFVLGSSLVFYSIKTARVQGKGF